MDNTCVIYYERKFPGIDTEFIRITNFLVVIRMYFKMACKLVT